MDQSLSSIKETFQIWLDTLFDYLPSIAIALIVFSLFYFLSLRMKRWSEYLLRKRIRQESVISLIGNLITLIGLLIGLFFALSILDLDQALTSILAGAGVVGLTVGLALQGPLSNTFSGIFLAIKDIVNVGDFIETNGYAGTVTKITLRNIWLREADNNLVIIPNKSVLENPFKNFSITKRIRVFIYCGISYDEDLNTVKTIALDTIKALFPKYRNEIEFNYVEFGASSVNFQLKFWIDATKNKSMIEARSDAIMAIKRKFDVAGIQIPYPTRTLLQQTA